MQRVKQLTRTDVLSGLEQNLGEHLKLWKMLRAQNFVVDDRINVITENLTK